MTRFGFVRQAITRPRSVFNQCEVALLCLGIASALRWALGHAADPVPFVSFFPGVMLCAVFAGWRPAVVAMIGSALIVNFVFLDHRAHVTPGIEPVLMIGLFFFSSLLLIGIAQALRRTLGEAVRDAERLEFLNRELGHRGRNLLSIVQVLAQQSVRSNPADFMPVFSKRLAALAGAYDIISQATGEACDLEATIQQGCAAFKHDDNFAITGPHCRISPEACVPLSLALHELCTNAVKHGGLSVPSGMVDISWTAPIDGITRFVWQERGGPEVKPPSRRGLGTVLLTSQRELGKADLHYLPEGLRCELALSVIGSVAEHLGEGAPQRNRGIGARLPG